MGVLIEWDEEPFEWVYPHSFGVLRSYRRGPLAEMRVRVTLDSLPEGGTCLTYEVWATPRNLAGLLAIPLQIGLLSARKFDAVMRGYDQRAERPGAVFPTDKSARLVPGGRSRLEDIRQRLLQAGFASELVESLLSLVISADDLSLMKIRPYAMADLWKRHRRQILELFLWATRLGLLEFRWDPLCPHCRQPPNSLSSLREVKARQHCPSCNLDFSANLDQTVELVFRPSPAIRSIPDGQKFCIAGPQTTPHVVAQQLLGPGENCVLQPNLETGHYRLRVLELPGAQPMWVGPDGDSEAVFRVGSAGWEAQNLVLSYASRLVFENATQDEQLFILEHSAWNAQATPAADVTSLQTFRDLFASEALRPDEPISVGSLAIVFTDLRGSTRLYREIGDAPAFGSVMEHFDVLRESITEAGGAVVKTMGDAVMAVFRRPIGALQAMLAAQQRLASPPAGERSLLLKVAIQYGPVIAITANERLDYFGTQVNLAARMVELSTGEDIILAESVFRDQEVAAALAEKRLQVDPFDTLLKGFDQESFQLWRVRAAQR
jgi:class 3 adenylate cyclase